MKKEIICSLILTLMVAHTVVAQQSSIDTLVRKFSRYRENALQEKLYAHVDRNFYLTGETLWFKLYSVDGSYHKPLDVSKVAYVELLDRAGLPVLQAKIELQNGTGHGSFFLPASLTSGHYQFRVYTNWMKNFNPGFYYHQLVTIVNPFVIPEAIPSRTPATYTVDFFPEGGRLVAGIQSKVAFKISDGSGKGITHKGFVVDNRGDTVVAFSGEKFGLGYFTITPSSAVTYRAVLAGGSGQIKHYPLPEVHEAGYVMQVRDSGRFLNVIVESRGVGQNPVLLLAHARQIIAAAQRKTVSGNGTVFSLDKSDLAEGISHLTLFSEALQPLCERLYFKYPTRSLSIGIATNQKTYTTRKKVSLSLETKTNSGTPLPANLSMSVYKMDSLSAHNSMSIFPYFWLGSDLVGTIESPEYYFEKVNEDVIRRMDNLMLTHGWRRFDWKNILEQQPTFDFLPELREHIVTAVVTKDGEKIRGVFVHLGSPGKIIRAYGSWSDPKGEVRFEIKDFYGPRRIILQGNDTANIYNIKVRDPFSTLNDGAKIPALRLRETLKEELESRSIAMQVQDIFYYEQFGTRMTLPVVDSSAFYGKADATYLLDDYTRFPVMEEVMREYVPGVFVRKRKDGFHFVVVDQVHGGLLSGDPMVLLDGVPVLDVDDIMRMDPLLVKKLEVVKRQYYLGQAVFSGIVSYTTYHGDLGGLEIDPRGISLNYDGLQLKRQFHKPQHTSDQSNDRMPDQRYLLHWEPGITTNEEGKHQLEFYTSDVSGKYLVVVEGFTSDGWSGSNTYTFTVNAPDSQ